MNNNTDFWFARVDRDVARDKVISVMARFIFMILCTFADRVKRGCWPSNATVAEAAGVSERTLLRAYKELEARGVIARESRFKNGQQTSSYTLIVGHNATCYRGVIDGGAGVSSMTDRTRISEQDIKDSLTREATTREATLPKNLSNPDQTTEDQETLTTHTTPISPEKPETPKTFNQAKDYDLSDVPDIMRPTAEYFLLKTGRKTLTEPEISSLRELSAHQYPSRVQKEINRACERFRRKGHDLGTLTMCYIASSLRNQPTLGRKWRAKSKPDPMSLTSEEIAQTQHVYTEEDMRRVEAMMRERG